MNARMVFTIVTGLCVIAAAAIAGETDKNKVSAAPAPVEWKHQTVCPVMGGTIDSSAYTDIQGQRVYHCCPMCTEKLTADPDTYFKKAAADSIEFENVQTTCPVCGMALAKDKTAAHDLRFEGRHLYFCSDGCAQTFQKDPQSYLKKMSAKQDETDHHEATEDHSGHSH